MIEKFVGDSLEIIGKKSFNISSYLKTINLKNVREIGEAAFQYTSLNMIKNNYI